MRISITCTKSCINNYLMIKYCLVESKIKLINLPQHNKLILIVIVSKRNNNYYSIMINYSLQTIKLSNTIIFHLILSSYLLRKCTLTVYTYYSSI